MPVVIVTGASGLVGSEAVRHFCGQGLDVIGIDNDMRRQFFGDAASTQRMAEELTGAWPTYRHLPVDIRDRDAIARLFRDLGAEIALVVHTAAQPSHDWAARDPETDFSINAEGTLCLLQATRTHAPGAVFIYTSTNKVYGDTPNRLPLVELESRWELDPQHPAYGGIDETMSIDRSTHSLFGVSKVAGDLLVQEYGRYFGIATACSRAGCITGPAHAGVELHGFLAYLLKCTACGIPYTVFGHKAKQGRDNVHGADLVRAFDAFFRAPRVAAVYNIGGARQSNCSILEAIALCEQITGRKLSWTYDERPRVGDHIWYVSDITRFRQDFPAWSLTYTTETLLRQMFEGNVDRWARETRTALKLSIVIPAHNEEGSIAATVTALAAVLQKAAILHEIIVVEDHSTDATAAVLDGLTRQVPQLRTVRNRRPPGYGHAVRTGLDAFTGDAVCIVMADASDDPKDVVVYYEQLQEGFDCVFGSRFMRGAQVKNYPVFKLTLNRIANLGIALLFGSPYRDWTNAFKCYRREVIDGVQPILACHFNLTVELPLKAVVRGFTHTVVPTNWYGRTHGVSKLRMKEMGSRYAFIILYVLLERWLSRGDYRRVHARDTL